MTHTVSARRRRTRRRGSRRPTFALRGFPPLRVDDSRHAELRNLRNGRLGRDHADALTRDQLLECVDAPKAELLVGIPPNFRDGVVGLAGVAVDPVREYRVERVGDSK